MTDRHKPSYVAEWVIKIGTTLALAAGAWVLTDFRDEVQSIKSQLPALTRSVDRLATQFEVEAAERRHRDARIDSMDERLDLLDSRLQTEATELRELRDDVRELQETSVERPTLLLWLERAGRMNPDLIIPNLGD